MPRGWKPFEAVRRIFHSQNFRRITVPVSVEVCFGFSTLGAYGDVFQVAFHMRFPRCRTNFSHESRRGVFLREKFPSDTIHDGTACRH